MNDEIWKPIKKFENYEISNYGNIKSLNYNRTQEVKNLKYAIKKGYKQVSLNKKGKQYFRNIHKLVAETFLNKKDFKSMPYEDRSLVDLNDLEVNHKNEIKTDNKVDNLEWCTRSYNRNYGTAIERAKPKISRANKGKHFSPKTEFKKGDNAKSIICIENNKIYNSIIEASIDLGITASNIVAVCKHYTSHKTAGGYHFEYK